MTSGSPMKLILGFSIPLLFGNLFQQFYSMVDTMIVGRVLGTGPLAAVGSTGSITFLIIGFCLGLCSGFAIPVAQCFGSRDYKELRRFIGNAVWLCVGFGIVLTVLTVIFCRNILELMGTPADIIDDAYAYLVIIFAGIPQRFSIICLPASSALSATAARRLSSSSSRPSSILCSISSLLFSSPWASQARPVANGHFTTHRRRCMSPLCEQAL